MKTSRICLRQPVLIWLSDFDFVHSVERTQFRWIVCDWWCSTCSRGSEIQCMRSLHDQQTDRITTTVPPYFIGSNHTMFLSSSSPSSWLSVVVAVGCVMRVAWLVQCYIWLSTICTSDEFVTIHLLSPSLWRIFGTRFIFVCPMFSLLSFFGLCIVEEWFSWAK